MSFNNTSPEDANKIIELQGKIFKLEKELKDSEANCNRIIAASQRGDKVDVLGLEGKVEKAEGDLLQEQIKVANTEAELTNAQRTIKGYQSECHEVDQALGQALGYPWYRDDEKNFPDATDADGVCTGEHTPSTIALEAARILTEYKAKIKNLEETMISPQKYDELQAKLDEALESQLSVFDMDYPPRVTQGGPRHEVEDLLTSDQANFWIQRIQALTVQNAELQQMLDNRNVDIRSYTTTAESLRETSQENLRQSIWRAERISQVEGLLQWALRKIIMDSQVRTTQHDIARANNIFRHIFPGHMQEYRTRHPGDRVNIPQPVRAPRPARHDDGMDAMAYAVATPTGRIR